MSSLLETLQHTLPQEGYLQWIGVRTGRGQPVRILDRVEVSTESGLAGDRFSGRPASPRQVTLIQAEHLEVLAQLLGIPIDPALLRRNLVIGGINLMALKGQAFSIGPVVLEGTRACAPCSKMEQALGPGGFNAMRGHGGLCARVLKGGIISVGDPVRLHVNRW
ncbi:MOSC domain-containing protein [Ferrimonas balearica]|uniref:MOSC domain-containing protein n=1 Tax=Ferrimonas balearica TaxID=44012 RepID=UPI001C993DA9|nr:MOSC domain-containing protein [Ferrimonas balearica]MBY5920112.1 MOSC domain-containing protein [Ferrimonas balearica]MBY5997203.1 MOSC domain-containing protein [Ferrimonas balearica]